MAIPRIIGRKKIRMATSSSLFASSNLPQPRINQYGSFLPKLPEFCAELQYVYRESGVRPDRRVTVSTRMDLQTSLNISHFTFIATTQGLQRQCPTLRIIPSSSLADTSNMHTGSGGKPPRRTTFLQSTSHWISSDQIVCELNLEMADGFFTYWLPKFPQA